MTTYTYLHRWENAENYAGEDYSDHYVVCSKHRDSDLMDESNFDCIAKELEAWYPDVAFTVRMGHWAVGWVEVLMVHEDNIECLEMANDIMFKIKERYPLFDEDDYYARREEVIYQAWGDMSESERLEICEKAGVECSEDMPYEASDYIAEWYSI